MCRKGSIIMKDFNGFEQYTNNRTEQVHEVPKKQKSGAKGIIAAAVACSILGGAVGAGGTYAGMRYFGTQTAQAAAVEKTSEKTDSEKKSTQLLTVGDNKKNVTETVVANGSLMTASEVYEKNVDSTVGITTSISTTNYFGYKTTAAASGSGFILSEDGYILTNHHVIEGANSITVTAYDGTTYDAELIGSDESNDIAVLKIDANGLTPVVLGTSDDIKVGDQVVAIGNPLGELTFSLTSGVVSALDREVTTEKATMNLIQTDCAINSGNSGGALFNMYGEVVGITNAKYSSGGNGEASIDNIGFAIPIDSVKSLVESLIEDGYITKPYIGVYVDNVSEDAVNYGLPKGASVKQIIEDSPAEKAGLKVNDIITEANGEEISSSNDLVKIVRKTEPGAKLVLKVYSQGEYKTVELLVEEKKQGQTDDASTEEDEQQYDPRMDEEYQEIDPFEGFGRMFGGY